MARFILTRVYKAVETFTLHADTIEEAQAKLDSGDWNADRDSDEYLSIISEELEPCPRTTPKLVLNALAPAAPTNHDES